MIVAAAIREKVPNGHKVYALPAPARHHDVIHYMATVARVPTPIRGEQGFIDSELGFVGRIQARDLVMHVYRQPLRDGKTATDHQSELFSEDLW